MSAPSFDTPCYTGISHIFSKKNFGQGNVVLLWVTALLQTKADAGNYSSSIYVYKQFLLA